MTILQKSPRRQGATTVEFAVVASALFVLLFALIVGGMGVFRYDEMAHLAREGARYASTHGGQYQLDGMPKTTGVPAVSSSSDLQTYLLTKVVGLDTSKLTFTISWSAPNTIVPSNLPTYVDTDPTLVPPGQKTIQNYVTVTVSYTWQPEIFAIGPFQLSSSSTMAMSY
jgi:Flp pilus assembly protein TadG